MKKLITLFLLFTITLFYSIPTQAYTLDGNDIPLVQTKNLFDKDTAISGFFIASDGTITSDTFNFYHPDFIPIEAGQTITTSNATATAHRIAFYNSAQVFISRDVVSSATSLTATAPANAKFFRVSGLLSQLNTFQSERGSTATSYAPYGFLTLNDIFLDGQLILNPNFNNGTTNWNITSATGSVSDGIYTFTASSIAGRIESIPNFTIIGNIYYSVSNFKASSSGVRLAILGGNAPAEHPGNNIFITISSRETASQVGRPVSIIDVKTTGFTPIEVDYVKSYNITNLGIDHLNKQTLDYYYNIWEQNNAYIDGYNQGELDGYADGLKDNTAYVQGYNVGYTDGLFRGNDMETGSSLLILIVALIGFILMIIGFITKRGIFNLLSTGAFIVLGGLLVEFVGFIIIAIGLVLINIYYAFFGNI